MDHRGLIARALIPIAIAIIVISISAPTIPARATEPAPIDPTTTEPAPVDPAPVEPAPVEPVVVEPAPVATTTTVAATSIRRHRRTAAERLIRVAKRSSATATCTARPDPALRLLRARPVLVAAQPHPGRRPPRGSLGRLLYAAYRRHHRIGRHHGHPGDLVIWGGGRHIGIYLGHGRALSALTRSGVSVHGLHAVTMSFNGFLRTRLWRHH